MPKFAANLSMQFTEVPFVERFSMASRNGFASVEFMFNEELPEAEITRLLGENGLRQVLANLPSSPTDKGVAAIPGAEEEFRERFHRGLSFASAAGCPLLHVTTGVVSDESLPESEETFLRNLEYAADFAKAADMTLVIEAINQIDVPGYFIRSLEDAVTRVRQLNRANVGIILDLYHAAMEGLELEDAIETGLRYSKHVQIAGAPGRNEPDSGIYSMERAFQLLDSYGYGGWVACEYRPLGDTYDGLHWLRSVQAA